MSQKDAKIFAFYFNEDGDPPRVQTFNSRKEFMDYVGENEIKAEKIHDPADFNPESQNGYLVIEGKALTLRPKKAVVEFELGEIG